MEESTHASQSDQASLSPEGPQAVDPEIVQHAKNPKRSWRPAKIKVLFGVGLAAVFIIIMCVGMLWSSQQPRRLFDENQNVNPREFQALFLTNGQVYFGRIANLNHRYVTLTDIYYLQVQQAVQPAANTNNSSQVSLAKLGSELHGPEDHMFVASDQVLFWENLKSDSKVVQAIRKYQSQ